MITVASETGIYSVDDEEILQKGRLSPGGIFAVNTESGEILDQKIIDDQLKQGKPYRDWLKSQLIPACCRFFSLKINSGLSSITVPKTTRSAPELSVFNTCSKERIPPPTISG